MASCLGLPESCSRYLSKFWNWLGKLLRVRATCMQSKVDLYQDEGTARESEEESKDGVFPSLSRRLPNLEDEIHLKGGRIVTP